MLVIAIDVSGSEHNAFIRQGLTQIKHALFAREKVLIMLTTTQIVNTQMMDAPTVHDIMDYIVNARGIFTGGTIMEDVFKYMDRWHYHHLHTGLIVISDFYFDIEGELMKPHYEWVKTLPIILCSSDDSHKIDHIKQPNIEIVYPS